MLNILYIGFDLFEDFKKNMTRLSRLNTKMLFMNCLLISSLGLISVFLGQKLSTGSSPNTVFFQLVSSYIYIFVFLSIVLTSLGILSHRINILQFLGLYLLMDFPLIGALPLYLIGHAVPLINFVTGYVIAMLGLVSLVLRFQLFMNYFKITFSQALVINIIPFLLLLLMLVSSSISLFDSVASLF